LKVSTKGITKQSPAT